MTAWKLLLTARPATLVLLFLTGAQSQALAKADGFQRDPLLSAERIDHLPPDVRSAIRRRCAASPSAEQYFATYLDNARIVRLHFEDFRCGGMPDTRASQAGGRCLRQEFVRAGTHYRLSRAYYGQCGD